MSMSEAGCVREEMALLKEAVWIKPVAILSTTVCPLDGVYEIYTFNVFETDFKGPFKTIEAHHPKSKDRYYKVSFSKVPHYIGHPDTKNIVESLGAIPAQSKLFPGLQPGEQALCFSISQGKSNRANNGVTNPNQSVNLSDLDIRVITRLQ